MIVDNGAKVVLWHHSLLLPITGPTFPHICDITWRMR